ncbi:alpha/beta fold hydrolase [Azospira restricta]|uniref:Alpha/beta fold hydrolase n=1 Tax=Azospira restricta TaxID=404405 RepID=A0A974SMH9_9RHOO|nr:alpha/beta fold hydrolase [Azospira restricta]QRJ62229.1 alpha/beta fold hydrolase [Azospira restricta]
MSLRIVSGGHAAGPDLALVHGWGLGAGAWDGVADALGERFRVHRVSLPGYDGSADDGRDFAQTAAALADALPAGTTLVGWSLGGMLALAAAAARPGRFAQLVLVGTTPKFVQADGWPCAQVPENHATFTRAVAKAAEATLTRFVMLFNQGDDKARAVVRALTPLLAAGLPPAPVLAKGLDWLRDVDLRAAVPGIATPALVVHGDCDPLMPIAAGEWLAAQLPAARLERFAGSAHAPFLADPDHFVRALAAFCAERSCPAASSRGAEVAQRQEGAR